jgi:hypothetical protein
MPTHLKTTLARLSVALLIPLALACGGNGGDSSDGVNATEVLSQSAAAVRDIDTLHFVLEHENGTTTLPFAIGELVGAEGDVIVPDKLSGELRAKASSVSVRVEVIGIGNDTWITNPFSRRWEKLPDIKVGDIANPTALIDALVQNIQNAEVTGRQDVDGTPSDRLEGTVDSGVLAGTLPGAEAGHELKVTLWVSNEDHLPRRARIQGRLSAEEPENIVRQLDLSKYNEPVQIDPP